MRSEKSGLFLLKKFKKYFSNPFFWMFDLI